MKKQNITIELHYNEWVDIECALFSQCIQLETRREGNRDLLYDLAVAIDTHIVGHYQQRIRMTFHWLDANTITTYLLCESTSCRILAGQAESYFKEQYSRKWDSYKAFAKEMERSFMAKAEFLDYAAEGILEGIQGLF